MSARLKTGRLSSLILKMFSPTSLEDIVLEVLEESDDDYNDDYCTNIIIVPLLRKERTNLRNSRDSSRRIYYGLRSSRSRTRSGRYITK
jgi:hypothetical protein